MDEFFLISKDVINEYKKETVDVVCNADHEEYCYEEAFIDIPKNKAELFKKINNKWTIIK